MGCALTPAILVVDDDADVRHITGDMLRREGYRVFEADGASEAIGRLSTEDVDALVTDIRMPGLSGFLLAQQAKLLQPLLAVIYTTGFIPQAQWDQRRSEIVVHKPYDGAQLCSGVARALAEKRGHAADGMPSASLA